MSDVKQLSGSLKDSQSIIFMVITLIMLLSFCYLGSGDSIQLRNLLVEDGLVENLGAFAYFIASLGFFWQSVKIRPQSKRWIWYALLGLLFFLCAGEEISWGQRLVGAATPDALKAYNAQGEFNIHNLWIFHYSNQDGSTKSGLETLLVPTRLLTLFFIAYTVILPLICHFSSSASTQCERLALPIPGWQPGVFFVMMLAADAAVKQTNASSLSRINELKEMYYGVCAVLLLFNLTVIDTWQKYRRTV